MNGGMIWYANTPDTHRFAEAWLHDWLANGERTGRYRDQPALNTALSVNQDIQLQILPRSCNVQVGMRSNLAEETLIWHIYTSTGLSAVDRLTHCCQRLMAGHAGYLPSKAISGFLKATTPK
jgi:hypothetical protein